MLNESLLALQRGVFMLSGMCHVLFCTYVTLCLYITRYCCRDLKFCVHNKCHHDSFVKSGISNLTLTHTNRFSSQITELLGTRCFATVVAFAAFENLPTSTGRIFPLLNCQVRDCFVQKGGKVFQRVKPSFILVSLGVLAPLLQDWYLMHADSFTCHLLSLHIVTWGSLMESFLSVWLLVYRINISA